MENEMTELYVDSVTNDLAEEGIKDLVEVIRPTVEEVKQAARTFLGVCNGVAAAYERGNQLIAKMEAFRHEVQEANKNKTPGEVRKLLQKNKAYQLQREEFANYFKTEGMKIYEELFKFQDVLNRALGQKVQMVYTLTSTRGKNIKAPVIYEIPEEQVVRYLKADSTRGALVGRINFSKKALQKEQNRILNALERNSNTLANGVNLENLDETYKEVIRRYNYTKSRCKGKFILYRNLETTPPPRWFKLSISGEGDVNEAYANVVLSRQLKSEFLFQSSYLEKNVGTFAKVIHLVDNISGLLEGDITVGNVEYAVKSPRAGTPGVTQFIEFAQEIIDNANFSIADLEKKKKELHDKGVPRNAITAILEDALTEADKDIIAASGADSVN